MWTHTTSLRKAVFYLTSVFLHLIFLVFISSFSGSFQRNKPFNQPFKVKLVVLAPKKAKKSAKFTSKRSSRKLKKNSAKKVKLKKVLEKGSKKEKKQENSKPTVRQGSQSKGFFSFSPPRVLLQVKPEYPFVARLRGYEGKVVLRALVGKNGVVLKIKIVKSSGYKILDQAAVRALYGWRFEPAKLNGLSVDYWVEIPVVFKKEIR